MRSQCVLWRGPERALVLLVAVQSIALGLLGVACRVACRGAQGAGVACCSMLMASAL